MPLQLALLKSALHVGLPSGLRGASRATQALVIARSYDGYGKTGVSCAMLTPTQVNFSDLKNKIQASMEKNSALPTVAKEWAAAFETYWTGALFGATGSVTAIGGTAAFESALRGIFTARQSLPTFIDAFSAAADVFTKTVIVTETLLPGPPAPPCGAAPIV